MKNTKLQQANENIETLINLLVNEKKSNLGSYCPYTDPNLRDVECERHEYNCDECKIHWKEDFRKYLLEKYIVN